MTSEAQLIFIRHGQHEQGSGFSDPSGLTDLGRQEARNVGLSLSIDLTRTKALSVDNVRSLATIALALLPRTPDDQIMDTVTSLKNQGTLLPTAALSYLPIRDKAFESQLSSAFSDGAALKFLVDHSDEYRLRHDEEMSSYSTLSFEVASAIKYFYDKFQADTDFYRLFCGREFVYACFRAKLIEGVEGRDARDNYIEWYSRTVERSSTAREDVASLLFSRDQAGEVIFKLTDDYGETFFQLEDIEEIIKGYENKFGSENSKEDR
jgi:hypothetical protein